MKLEKITINRKHEMFWNLFCFSSSSSTNLINRKHEMFWNVKRGQAVNASAEINRKHEMFWNEVEKYIKVKSSLY